MERQNMSVDKPDSNFDWYTSENVSLTILVANKLIQAMTSLPKCLDEYNSHEYQGIYFKSHVTDFVIGITLKSFEFINNFLSVFRKSVDDRTYFAEKSRIGIP